MSHTKNKRRLSKKKFLLSSKKCWVIEDKLLPLYSHLVQSYSDQLKDTWTVKLEESQFGSVQIKEEPTDEINYDTPIIIPTNEVCIDFHLLPSCLRHFTFIIFHFLIPSQIFIPTSSINDNILVVCHTGKS